MSSAAVNIPKSLGALLIGGLYASLLSGLVLIQVIIYFKLYPSDSSSRKSLVLAVWLLDSCHTGFIWSALWSYLIDHYGQSSGIDDIHWEVALTIVVTAVLTFFVHLFFANRIFMLSKRNYWLTAPIVGLATLRLVSASVTTAEMLHLATFSKFKHEIRWVFTTGLALSTAVDIIITVSLFVLLHTSRTGAESLNAVIDKLIRYTFETGALTCAGTVISMICWLTMPGNLIFLGLHFVIGKLYANSLLVTLNMREKIRSVRSQSGGANANDYAAPVHLLDTRRRRSSHSETIQFNGFDPTSTKASKIQTLEVNVERSVQYDVEN